MSSSLLAYIEISHHFMCHMHSWGCLWCNQTATMWFFDLSIYFCYLWKGAWGWSVFVCNGRLHFRWLDGKQQYECKGPSKNNRHPIWISTTHDKTQTIIDVNWSLFNSQKNITLNHIEWSHKIQTLEHYYESMFS